MKIIFVTRENKEMPAVRIRCHNFARALREKGIETEVFSYADILNAQSGSEEKNMTFFEKIGYNLKAYKQLSKHKAIIVLQRLNYHSFAPLFLKLFKDYKLVFDVDDWEAREDARYYLGRIPNSRAEFLMRFTAKKSCLCVGASRFLFDYLSQYNKNTVYLPTAVDTDVFKPADAAVRNNNIILSWAGTVYRRDNVENIAFLLDCFARVNKTYPQARLEIAGQGSFYPDVEKIISGYENKNISLKPWISPDKMPDYMRTVDIGIMPLIQKTKFNMAKSPTRLFEYMASAKPVVASDIGEAAGIIRHKHNGFLAGGKEDFIGCLSALIEDAGLRRKIGENARTTMEKDCSLKKTAQLLYDKIKNL